MRRPSDSLRDDRLGSMVRAGLGDVRKATPSPGVWSRIADSIEPRRRVGPVRSAIRRLTQTGPGWDSGSAARRWLLLPGSAALAVLLLVSVSRVAPLPVPGSERNQGRPIITTVPRAMPEHNGFARVETTRPAAASADALGQIEAPQPWSRSRPDEYRVAVAAQGPTDWLPAPQIALTY